MSTRTAPPHAAHLAAGLRLRASVVRVVRRHPGGWLAAEELYSVM